MTTTISEIIKLDDFSYHNRNLVSEKIDMQRFGEDEVNYHFDEAECKIIIDYCREISRGNSAEKFRLFESLWKYVFDSKSGPDFPSRNPPEEYFSILLSALLPQGFESSEAYVDKYYGHVVDFFRDRDRITCIVAAEDIQMLSYLNECFGEKMFDRTRESKTKIAKYLNGLIEA